MKKTLYIICIAALLGLFVGLAYNLNTQTPKAAEKPSAPVLAKKMESPPVGSIAMPPSPATGNAAVAKEQGRMILSSGLVIHGVGVGADYALVSIAYHHPELKLKPEEAADLQEIFSSNYLRFAKFQAKISYASIQPDGSTLIQIPAFPTQAQQLVDDFMADVRSYYNGNVPAGVADAILKTYSGYTNSAGTTPISLKVTVSKDPNYSYDVIRTTVSLDPKTRRVRSVGESRDQITKDLMLISPYSELSSLFPKPKG